MLIALVVGLAAGCGSAFGVDYLDQSFRDIDDLEQFLSIPVLACIPRIKTKEDSKKSGVRKKVALFSCLGAVVALIALAITHLYLFSLTSWIAK
jgi:hypothetical protein